MGKRGPKPGGSLANVEVIKQRPRPLHGMSGPARYIWKRIVNAYPVDHFKAQHLGILRSYCETEAMYKQAIKEIRQSGVVITQENGTVKRNPWCAERDALAATLSNLGTKLGITVNATSGRKESGKSKKRKSKRDGLMFNG